MNFHVLHSNIRDANLYKMPPLRQLRNVTGWLLSPLFDVNVLYFQIILLGMNVRIHGNQMWAPLACACSRFSAWEDIHTINNNLTMTMIVFQHTHKKTWLFISLLISFHVNSTMMKNWPNIVIIHMEKYYLHVDRMWRYSSIFIFMLI